MTSVELPEALKEHLPTDLGDNKENYPEFNRKTDASRIVKARDRLMRLKLLHATDPGSMEVISSEGLKPVSELPNEAKNNTFNLDRSLGLDRAVFFGWGTFYDRRRDLWVTADAELLLDDHAVVTPGDINSIVWSQDTPFDNLSSEKQREVSTDYFEKMLTGSDWLEMMARRIAQQRDERVKMYSGVLGEVKVFQAIPSSDLMIAEDPTHKQMIETQMHNHGFVEP